MSKKSTAMVLASSPSAKASKTATKKSKKTKMTLTEYRKEFSWALKQAGIWSVDDIETAEYTYQAHRGNERLQTAVSRYVRMSLRGELARSIETNRRGNPIKGKYRVRASTQDPRGIWLNASTNDSLGKSYHQDLSKKRAVSVAKSLAKKCGSCGLRFEVYGQRAKPVLRVGAGVRRGLKGNPTGKMSPSEFDRYVDAESERIVRDALKSSDPEMRSFGRREAKRLGLKLKASKANRVKNPLRNPHAAPMTPFVEGRGGVRRAAYRALPAGGPRDIGYALEVLNSMGISMEEKARLWDMIRHAALSHEMAQRYRGTADAVFEREAAALDEARLVGYIERLRQQVQVPGATIVRLRTIAERMTVKS